MMQNIKDITTSDTCRRQDEKCLQLRKELDQAKKRLGELDRTQQQHPSSMSSFTKPDWKSTINTIPVPIFLHDHNFLIIQANHAYAKLAALPLEQILGRPYWQLFPKLEGPLPGCKDALSHNKEIEEDVVLSTGEIFRSWAFAILDDDGQYNFSVHLLEEVTEVRTLAAQSRQMQEDLQERSLRLEVQVKAFKRAKQSLLNSEERLRTIVEHSADGIIVLNKKMNVLFVNPAASSLFARTEEQLLDKKFGFPLITGETSEIEVVRPDGKIVSVEMRVVAIEWQGQSAHVVSLHDISERKCLEVERREHIQKNQATLVETIETMARAMETRDPYTAGHQQRVANLAVAIAREMGLAEKRIEGIRLGGAIHDIGKLYVPAEILNRPGKLSDIEFKLIQTHPEKGYQIMKDVSFPWPVAEIIFQHHERLDGSGYPQGLKGDEIVLEARILTVADVVEAMGSHRPYRPALSMETALEHIIEKRGVWFEAKAVDACIRLFQEKNYTLE